MRRLTIVAAAVLAGGLAVTGCGSNSLSKNSGQPTATVSSGVDAAAAALVPANLKGKTLTVGTDASYAPSESLAGDGKTIEGFDVDLFKAVAATLGLKVQFENASFGTIIAGVVKSAKYDIGVSSFSITADREKQATMISYFSAGTAWATASGNPKKVDPTKPCGINVAVQSNTTQALDQLPLLVKACQKAGKPIHVDSYDQQSQATASVISGKDDAMLADSPVVADAIKHSNGKLEGVGSMTDTAPYGYVLPKSETGFANAIVAALKVLKSNGTYDKILNDWGVQQGAISDFVINPPAK